MLFHIFSALVYFQSNFLNIVCLFYPTPLNQAVIVKEIPVSRKLKACIYRCIYAVFSLIYEVWLSLVIIVIICYLKVIFSMFYRGYFVHLPCLWVLIYFILYTVAIFLIYQLFSYKLILLYLTVFAALSIDIFKSVEDSLIPFCLIVFGIWFPINLINVDFVCICRVKLVCALCCRKSTIGSRLCKPQQ